MLTLGIDVGGSKLLACAVDARGEIVLEERHETGRATGPAALTTRVVEMVSRLRARGQDPDGIGVGFPGLVDHRAGVVRSSIMLDGWREVPLAAELSRSTGLPCTVDNDVNAAAFCEVALRGGREHSVLFVAIGTGIGGALWLDGALWRGCSSVAGEIGNTVVDPDGERCRCGRRGCLNTVASGSALERAARVPPGTLASRFAAGEPAVLRAVERGARLLAIVLGNVVNLLNPSLVVLGGGVAELGEPWLQQVRAHLGAESFAEAAAVCRVERSRAGYRAGAAGAALLARTARSGFAEAEGWVA